MSSWKWRNPPNTGFRLNRDSPLARGLVGWWPLSGSRGGLLLRDYSIFKLPSLSIMGTATWDINSLRCDATGEGAEVTTPASLKLGWPLTLAFRARVLGTPTGDAGLFGVTPNNTDSDPYLSYEIGSNSGSLWRIVLNNGGSFTDISSSTGIAAYIGLDVVAVAVITATTQILYVNNVAILSATNSISNPTFGATSLLHFGNYTGISRNSNMAFEWGAVWNRALSPVEVGRLYNPSTRFDLYQPIPEPHIWFAAAAGPFMTTNRGYW